MEIENTFINGLYIINPQVFEDNRGNFYESYSDKKWQELGISLKFVQDNESYNKKRGTIRGIHLQVKEMSQNKLIHVSQGSIYGVCVDLRKSSPTYKKYYSTVLSSDNHKQILVPKGCGWGFQTLVDDTVVCYKLDNLYNGDYERGIAYDDDIINIDWPIKDDIIISNKDMNQVKVDNLINDILITGVDGQLGHDLYEILKNTNYNIIGTKKQELNICNKEEVEKFINRIKPDIIINCAAYTNVEKAEKEDKQLCYDINVTGTKNLLEYAKKVDAKFVYISSDYVFDGKKEDKYKDVDTFNPQNYYGLTKLLGEEITKEYKKHFIIRTSWLFGINGNNFVKSMINLAKKQNEVAVVSDQIGSPTYSKDLAKAIAQIITTDYYGSYNVTNSGFCSWHEFAEYIFNTFNLNVKVKEISTVNYQKKTGSEVVRPLNSRLEKENLKRNFKELPTWQDALARYKIELEETQKQD